MLINPYSGVVNSSLSGARTTDRIQKSVEQLSSGDRITRAADDVASLSAATNLQNQITGLRSALNNTSQFSSLTQSADSGIEQIQNLLGRAQDLATQANNGALNDDNRAALDLELQSIVAEIDRVASNTQFNDINLLDGSLSGDNALTISGALGQPETDDSDGESLNIESLGTSALLGEISIATQEDAQAAINTIQQAQNSVGTTRASVGAFNEQLDFASAFLETAIANQDAARATLSDADFAEAASELSSATLQQDLQVAVEAQVKRLAPSMLKLLQS